MSARNPRLGVPACRGEVRFLSCDSLHQANLEVATTPLSKDRQEVLAAMKLADSVISKTKGELA